MPASFAFNQDTAEATMSDAESDQPPNPATISLECHTELQPSHRLDLEWLKLRLEDAIQRIDVPAGRQIRTLSVLIVGDGEMTKLHGAHAGVEDTTDVLSFDLSSHEPGSAIEADIVVNAAEAARRAGEFGHSVERELLLYCLHGLLHCCGFDDHTESDWQAMHAEEDRILMLIGVGSTFRPDEGGAR